MQPRRDAQHTPYDKAQEPAQDRLEEESYQPVKPVGYEARMAFEQERASRGQQGRPGPAVQPHTGAPVYGRRQPYPPVNGPLPGASRGQAPYPGAQRATQPSAAGTAYRPPTGRTQPYPPPQGVGTQTTGQQPLPEYPEPPAEELLRDRSPDLMEKRGDFWKPVGKTPAPETKDKPKEKTSSRPVTKQTAKPRKNHVVRGLLRFLAVAFGVGILVRSVLFTVRAVQVSGNVNMTEAQVLSVAGISLGANMFELDETEIARRVNANHYLSFEKLRLDWPDGVTLFVRERVPCAYANAYGMLYILADDGTVLEDSNDIDTLPDLPVVRGFREGDVVVGRKIAPEASEKLVAYKELIAELQTQEYLEQISVLNISDVDNIYLETTDHYTVEMGDSSDMRAKVGAMRAVVDKLREMGKESGIINVADDPVHPTYMP